MKSNQYNHRFISEIISKIEQNKNSRLSSEKYLNQIFKFFDSDNDDHVNQEQFIKCIKKIGYVFITNEVFISKLGLRLRLETLQSPKPWNYKLPYIHRNRDSIKNIKILIRNFFYQRVYQLPKKITIKYSKRMKST